MLDHILEATSASIYQKNQDFFLDLSNDPKLRSTKIHSSKHDILAYTHSWGHKEPFPKTSSHLDLVWTHVRQTRVCETNTYVSLQGLENDDLMFPPILYMLMNGKVVFFWEMVFSMSRLSHS